MLHISNIIYPHVFVVDVVLRHQRRGDPAGVQRKVADSDSAVGAEDSSLGLVVFDLIILPIQSRIVAVCSASSERLIDSESLYISTGPFFWKQLHCAWKYAGFR